MKQGKRYFSFLLALVMTAVMGLAVYGAEEPEYITRYEYLQQILLDSDIPIESASGSTFLDVADWQAPVVETAASLGIVRGSYGYFRPSDYITKDEALVMLVNSKGVEFLNRLYSLQSLKSSDEVSQTLSARGISYAAPWAIHYVDLGLAVNLPDRNFYIGYDGRDYVVKNPDGYIPIILELSVANTDDEVESFEMETPGGPIAVEVPDVDEPADIDPVEMDEDTVEDVTEPEEEINEDITEPEEEIDEDITAPEAADEDVTEPEAADEDVAEPEAADEDVAEPEVAADMTAEELYTAAQDQLEEYDSYKYVGSYDIALSAGMEGLTEQQNMTMVQEGYMEGDKAYVISTASMYGIETVTEALTEGTTAYTRTTINGQQSDWVAMDLGGLLSNDLIADLQQSTEGMTFTYGSDRGDQKEIIITVDSNYINSLLDSMGDIINESIVGAVGLDELSAEEQALIQEMMTELYGNMVIDMTMKTLVNPENLEMNNMEITADFSTSFMGIDIEMQLSGTAVYSDFNGSFTFPEAA